jgi:CHAT domain-containing protein
MFSSLALRADDRHDGLLTTLDVFRLKAPADLVVLSACETARGKVYRAEGVIGFTRAFMFAGAPRVICSLWKVDDEATKTLMVKLYELWKPGKMSTATALKRAQEYVANHEEWNHPVYWAAWQLWGLRD